MATMENMENKEKVIEIIPKKEGSGKKLLNGMKTFWRRNKWWICGMFGAIAGAAAVYKAMNSNGEEVPAEESNLNTIDVDGVSAEIPADTSTEE